MSKKRILGAAIAVAAACGSMTAGAAEWSATTLTYSYGTGYTEPTAPNKITKHTFSLFTISGYKYGTQLFNADFLLSDDNDPAAPSSYKGLPGAIAGAKGAQEVYAIYRNTLSLSKVTGSPWSFGPVSDVGLTFGVDLNSKNDVFAPRVRKLTFAPTFTIPIDKGNLSLYAGVRKEWNHCGISGFAGSCVTLGRQDVTFDAQGVVGGNWFIPFGSSGFRLTGRFEVAGKKGKNGFNGDTATESFISPTVFYAVTKDLSVGVGYQYWKNKFGADGGVGSKTSAFEFKVAYDW